MNCHLALLGNGVQADNLSARARSTSCLEQPQRAPQVTISEPKGKTEAKIFLGTYFFFPSQNTMSNVWGKGNMYGAREVWVVGHTLIFFKKR